jgi:hypothetical protein
MTIFYCLIFETLLTWMARSPYLYLQETGWSNYTPRWWVPFSSPFTTGRATVEILEPDSTRANSTTRVKASQITTDGQSVNQSWCQAPFGARNQIFVTVRQLRFVDMWRPLWREDGSVIYWGQNPLSVKSKSKSKSKLLYDWSLLHSPARTAQKTPLILLLYCCVFSVTAATSCHVTFTGPIPRNGRVCHNVPYQRLSLLSSLFWLSRRDTIHMVAHGPVAKQSLGKQWPLLGNTRNVHALNNRRTVLSMLSASRPLLCNDAVNTPPKQQRDCVFCVVRAEEISWRKLTLHFSWEFSCGILAGQ